jgi:drug/metabolite transporter (DMT)-like permease
MESMIKNAFLVFLGACSFGVLSTFVKLAYGEGYTLGEVSGVQVFFGMLILWMLFFFGKAAGLIRERPKQKKDPVWKLIVSGFSSGTVSIVYYKCVELVPASIAIVLLMQFVWIGILLELLLFKSKPSRQQVYSMILVLAGTVLAAGLFNQQEVEISLAGVLYGLLAATFYSVFLIVNSRVGNDYPPVQKSAFMLTGACLLVFIVFPPSFIFNGVLLGKLWQWGLLLSVFGTVIPPLFFAIGIPRIGVPVSSIISAAELPVAVAMSYFVLAEKVTALQWIGVAIILSAIVFSNLFGRKKLGKSGE